MTIVTIAGNKSQLSTSTARTPRSSTSESAGHQPNSAVLWRRIATPTHSAAKLATASAKLSTTTPRRGGVNSSWIARSRAVIILGLGRSCEHSARDAEFLRRESARGSFLIERVERGAEGQD